LGNTTTFTALPEHKSKFCSTNNNNNNNNLNTNNNNTSENGIFLNRSTNNYIGDTEKKLTIVSAEESSVNAGGSKKFGFISNIASREIKETDIQGDLED